MGADPPVLRGRPLLEGRNRATESRRFHRGIGDGMHDKEIDRNTGSPCGEGRDPQPAPREGPAGPYFINTAIAAALMGRGPAAGVGPAGPLPFGSLHRAKSGRLLGTPLPQRLRPLVAAATVLICTAGYGAVRIHTFAVEPMNDGVSTGSSSVSVAIVQGALPSGRTDLGAANEEAWITYSSLSASNLGPAAGGGSAGPLAVGSLQPAKPDSLGLDADLVVWPETVLRVYLRENEHYQRRVFDFVHTLQRPLLLGSLDRPRRGPVLQPRPSPPTLPCY